MRFIWKKEGGQTLLEILLAFAISVSVLGAIAFGVITALDRAQYAKTQSLANSYAQEGLAAVRVIRDSGWKTFSDYQDGPAYIYCIDRNLNLTHINAGHCMKTSTEDNAVGPENMFSREVVFVHASPECAGAPNGTKVAVAVLWSDGKCPVHGQYCHKVEQTTCFFNMDEAQAP